MPTKVCRMSWKSTSVLKESVQDRNTWPEMHSRVSGGQQSATGGTLISSCLISHLCGPTDGTCFYWCILPAARRRARLQDMFVYKPVTSQDRVLLKGRDYILFISESLYILYK